MTSIIQIKISNLFFLTDFQSKPSTSKAGQKSGRMRKVKKSRKVPVKQVTWYETDTEREFEIDQIPNSSEDKNESNTDADEGNTFTLTNLV